MGKLRESARGRECQVRIHPFCNHDPTTVVLAHMNGGGMGMKKPNIHASFCCSGCHDVVDGRKNTSYTSGDLKRYFYEGIFRTQQIWLDEGLITTK